VEAPETGAKEAQFEVDDAPARAGNPTLVDDQDLFVGVP
jgi:hypothetical protein